MRPGFRGVRMMAPHRQGLRRDTNTFPPEPATIGTSAIGWRGGATERRYKGNFSSTWGCNRPVFCSDSLFLSSSGHKTTSGGRSLGCRRPEVAGQSEMGARLRRRKVRGDVISTPFRPPPNEVRRNQWSLVKTWRLANLGRREKVGDGRPTKK